MGKNTAILDPRQIQGRGKQYKCLMHGYWPYKYKYINTSSKPHDKHLIKSCKKKKKTTKAKVAAVAIVAIKTTQWSTKIKLPLLVDNNDIMVEDANSTQ